MKDKTLIVENELFTLEKAIGYSERNIADRDYQFHDPNIAEKLIPIHAKQKAAYQEFMRVAWGKAVRIRSEHKGEIVYRLSQSAAVIPGLDISTPQSPIGRLVNIARPGATRESDALGEYSIEDVWYFERYTGREYSQNLTNFKKMTSEGKNVFSIRNLLKWLKQPEPSPAKESDEIDDLEKYSDVDSPWEKVTFLKDKEEIEVEPHDDHEGLEDKHHISLPTAFYVNLNTHQYDAAHFGPAGLVFVFGIAGSGKTSVALGRSKSLAQLGQLPKEDPLYNNEFPEESQLGVVKTGELITYLKETCNMLSLHRLPIVEYREIYEELKTHWDIEQVTGRTNSPRFLLADEKSHTDAETRTSWFNFISEAMLEHFSSQALKDIRNQTGTVSDIDGDFLLKVIDILESDLKPHFNNTSPRDYLYKIEASLKNCIEEIFNRSVWIGIQSKRDNIVWVSDQRHNIARTLRETHKILCLFLSVNNVQFIIPQNEIENWGQWIPRDAKYQLKSESNLPDRLGFNASDGSVIESKLIVASDDEITQYAKNGKLRFYIGIGETTKRVLTRELLLAHMPDIVSSRENQRGSEKNTREWRKKIRDRVVSNLKKPFSKLIPSDLFMRTISSLSLTHDGKFYSLLKAKNNQLNERKLSTNDIDLLIAFMASITRKIDSEGRFLAGRALRPAPYRSSIFIDEVQDFSEIQILSLSLLASPKYDSITAVGDPAQCLYRAAANIADSFPPTIWQNAKKQELVENIRQERIPTVRALSSAFRNSFIKDVEIDVGSYEKNQSFNAVHRANAIEQMRYAYKTIASISRQDTVVIVVPTVRRARETIEKLKPHLREKHHRECEHSLTVDLSKRYIAHVTTPKNIKGLEFDHLIALYLEEYDLNESDQKNALYVMMTRPKKNLTLIGNFNNTRGDFLRLIENFSDIQGL